MPNNELNYSATTELKMITPELIRVIPVGAGVMKYYQKLMSKAVWRPSFGRKLGFLVVHGDDLLGLIFLATPVIRLGVRDKYLFPDAGKDFDYGTATRNYMDMSVCVAAQPIGWYWNLGKLMAMIAPTLGDFVKARYGDELKGITTTSLFGKSNGTQYTRIYKYLGETEGSGHENVDGEAKEKSGTYAKMMAFLRAHCENCNPGCDRPLELTPTVTQKHDNISRDKWCTVPGCRWRKGSGGSKSIGDGSNPRRRRIAAFFKALETLNMTPLEAIGEEVMGHDPKNKVKIDKKGSTYHGRLRGVYYHPAVDPAQRFNVIQKWYERWGFPRYERKNNFAPPYQNGKDGEGYERIERLKKEAEFYSSLGI